ncbi:acyl-CoA synthetase [Salinilacihabitans rarus]|uniref:acyl-CoA synthetase n=1 Tax=Salinilacihabitans rarus TaxID=2961596 RepID=UPI0020C8D61F|nr:AMP-binding protein [Salinilacihabitans rarus]
MASEHNLDDYDSVRESFTWDDVFAEADWEAPASLNIAHEVCDRHASDGDRIALRQVGVDGESRTLTFAELAERSNRFADVLADLGVGRGERVFTYLPRIPAHYVALVGTLKRGAVFGGINERFGPDGIAYRLADCDAAAVVTTSDNRETVATALEEVPSVEHVIVVDRGDGIEPDDVDFEYALAAASPQYETARTSGDDDALLYYTSGTTGPAKGVLHEHRWIAGVAATQRFAADLRPDDLYWSTGDLGWLTGPINTLGAWFWGTPLFTYEGEFDPETWADLLDEYPITVLFSVPTAYRMLRENEDALADADLDLRHALSIGEPLSAGVVEWGEETLGVTIHDTYGQTETGNMIVDNYPTMEVRPGSMGKPLPGVTAEIVDPETGEPLEPGETGEIAQRGDYPCFFAGYWEKPDRTEACFVNGWYLSGDLAHKDEDGYFWFEGRADDVIISAGYRIGPFEVESSLGEHSAVAEAAVVPKPDEKRGSIVKAYVVPSEGADPSPDLKAEIKTHVREELSAHEYPREIEFREDLPKTVTGKIRRTELREETGRAS